MNLTTQYEKAVPGTNDFAIPSAKGDQLQGSGSSPAQVGCGTQSGPAGFEAPVDVKAAAKFLGVSRSLVYAYVERKQIPHFRMMGRAIRFRLSELDLWRQQFHVNGGING